MKLFLAIAVVAFLIGCNSTNNVKLSSAIISSITKTVVSERSFEFSFDYKIDDFIDKKNTYFCSVHVLSLGGKTIMSPVAGEATNCLISDPSGSVKVSWTSETESTSLQTDPNVRIKYFIAIYQNETSKVSHSIANSQLVSLK